VCVCMDWFAFFCDIIGPAIGYVPKLLICSWSVSFPFPCIGNTSSILSHCFRTLECKIKILISK
jgi:hypothetical protein